MYKEQNKTRKTNEKLSRFIISNSCSKRTGSENLSSPAPFFLYLINEPNRVQSNQAKVNISDNESANKQNEANKTAQIKINLDILLLALFCEFPSHPFHIHSICYFETFGSTYLMLNIFSFHHYS